MCRGVVSATVKAEGGPAAVAARTKISKILNGKMKKKGNAIKRRCLWSCPESVWLEGTMLSCAPLFWSCTDWFHRRPPCERESAQEVRTVHGGAILLQLLTVDRQYISL